MNDMRDEFIEWLLSSAGGQTAVAPFPSKVAMYIKFQNLHSIMGAWDGFSFDWSNLKISAEGRGSIEFSHVRKGVQSLNGRTWSYAFNMQGPMRDTHQEERFMSALLERVVHKNKMRP